MDEITKQIQQLKVTNRHKYGDPPAFLKETSKSTLDDTIDFRKNTAPSVPPKPNKKSPNYAEVSIALSIHLYIDYSISNIIFHFNLFSRVNVELSSLKENLYKELYQI